MHCACHTIPSMAKVSPRKTEIHREASTARWPPAPDAIRPPDGALAVSTCALEASPELSTEKGLFCLVVEILWVNRLLLCERN